MKRATKRPRSCRARWLSLVALLFSVGCIPLCAWNYDQTCTSSEDCSAATLDPCNGCPDVAVNVDDVARFVEDREQRRRFCPVLLEIECQPIGAACVDGRCELGPPQDL